MPSGADYNVMPLWQNNILLAHLQPRPRLLKKQKKKKIKLQLRNKSSFHTLLLKTTLENIISASEYS